MAKGKAAEQSRNWQDKALSKRRGGELRYEPVDTPVAEKGLQK